MTDIRVRELPPLRLHVEAETPSGAHYRWGEDEPNAINVPSGLRFSSTMPGGFESLDCVLPRRPETTYADLDRLTTLRVWAAGGDLVGEYRLERVPRTSGNSMTISPSAVGWQAHLEDDKSASVVFIDRDMAAWGQMSAQRQINLITAGFSPSGATARVDDSGINHLVMEFNGDWASTGKPNAEAWYDAGAGNRIAKVKVDWAPGKNVNTGDANWQAIAYISLDMVASANVNTGDLSTGPIVQGSVTATTPLRYAFLQFFYNSGPAGTSGVTYDCYWGTPRAIGNHGLTTYGASGTDEGLLASDMASYAVGRWAPLLTYTAGVTVLPSVFAIPHASFKESTTAGEIVRQVTRYGLQDWAVWDDKTFWWHDRGVYGRSWRARIAPAQLEETGPQVDRLWSSIIVQYQDASGATRTVGPVGSGADTEASTLSDTDPDNPANKLGITRRDKLVMNTGTAASATEVGRRFLEETKALDRSGRAKLVGHVIDDRGVLHPHTRVRAGDTISFVDAADTSERRIVRADHDRASRSTTIDLDAPPDSMAALLERLDVVLVGKS